MFLSKKIFIIFNLSLYVFFAMPLAMAQSVTNPEVKKTSSLEEKKEKDTPLPSFVAAPKEVSDSDIQHRLEKIFATTGWFPKLKIEVKEGLVFLKGHIDNSNKKAWAAKMIEKTEGVIGIIDELDDSEMRNVLSPAEKEVHSIFDTINKSLPYVLSAIIIFILFFGLAYFLRKSVRSITLKRSNNELVASALSNSFAALILIVGLYFALKASGLSTLAVSVLGGTGFLGIGLGLALKSSLENYTSSILISLREVIRRGDWVLIGNQEGIVHSVSTRGTTLMDFDGNTIVIPNADVFNSVIKNFTRNPKTRTFIEIGIGYNDSIEEAQELILNTLGLIPEVLKDPSPAVFADSLSGGTVYLKVFFWFDSVQTGRTGLRSKALCNIKSVLSDAGMSLPMDTREVVFTNGLQIKRRQTKDVSENDLLTVTQKSSTDSSTQNVASSRVSKQEEPFDSSDHDTTSDVQEIREQAQATPAPEKGADILKN